MTRATTTLVLTSLLACPPASPGTGEATSAGSGSERPGTTTASDTPTSAASTSSSGTTSRLTGDTDTSTSVPFIAMLDGGFDDGCELAAQTCPKGQKCNPSGMDTGFVFTGQPLCVPLEPDPKPPGEPCSVLGDPLDGTDECELGSVCLFPDDQGMGLCHALCSIDDDPQHDSSCPIATTLCNPPACQECNWGYCDEPCDPRDLDACPAKELCAGFTEGLFCLLDGSGGGGGNAGDPCEFLNACAPGLRCADAETVAGCPDDASGCCAPFCSTDQPNTCPNKDQGEVCVPWFVDNPPPPKLATLGSCSLPP